MKKDWHPDELAHHWSLCPDERDLLGNKSGATRLNFAILLKAFHLNGRFPERQDDVAGSIVAFVAKQVGVAPEVYFEEDWSERTQRFQRAQVRDHCGFHAFHGEDEGPLVQWLSERVVSPDPDAEVLKIAAYAQLRSQQLEPPGPDRLRRLLGAAVERRKQRLLTDTAIQLSHETRAALDALVQTGAAESEADQLPLFPVRSELAAVREDPGAVKVETVLEEIDKLKKLRALNLPDNLFRDAPGKIVTHYRQRAATEPPREIRRHLSEMRYTLLASLCWQRQREITDNLVELLIRYITNEHMRAAIAKVCNAIFHVRNPDIWGEATTACASDSKKFGAWDQNLMTEWHVRYGGRGVMIYWHVEKHSVCIYSQLKTCSSSEVSAMVEGVLRHDTDMDVEKQYVDTHGQSEVGFAFCHLLGFALLPRLKNLKKQKLYRPQNGDPGNYPNLQAILTRPINWEIIEQQYDELIKFATALRLGTADAESIMRRFTKNNVQHPTYKALCELGKALKTVFLCDYLCLESLRREIHERLQVIENWNSANDFILYGKGGEFASNRLENQELLMLSLHLLQVSLVYVNTLMIQQVLAEPDWCGRLTAVDCERCRPLSGSTLTRMEPSP